ncbi:Protein N-terminal glutamine amidohydrolase [Portunus trituberculatus]|uniref:Protein tungus n=1 Tax=Portunus trituberculatus TaxID=210409 RepID=A0A5B7EAR9_PORTR|nr:Protein N-terminal glutamine amidohydrolase [Portunus trituberculatus]
MYEPDERCLVFDLDSDLPFPTYFHKYVTETLRTDHILRPEHYSNCQQLANAGVASIQCCPTVDYSCCYLSSVLQQPELCEGAAGKEGDGWMTAWGEAALRQPGTVVVDLHCCTCCFDHLTKPKLSHIGNF